MDSTWSSPIYRQTALIVLSAIFLGGFLVYFVRNKNHYFMTSWASIKSWLIMAPIFFIFFRLTQPWPLIFITVLAIFGTKIFFQLMGMYHRSYFVTMAYLGIVCLSLAIYFDRHDVFNLIPMIFFGLFCMIPLARNNYKQMIQYISISNLAFVLLGWALMHLGWIMRLEKGLYQVMYLIILTEFCDNTNLSISKYIGRWHVFNRIDNKRTMESTIVSALLTVLLAFVMRYLLPDQSEVYWLVSGVIASLGGIFGDIVMTVIRRDAGIRVVGAFVWGRGDFLHRMDRLIFVAPIYYFVIVYIPNFVNMAGK